jgi:hypothetical protein
MKTLLLAGAVMASVACQSEPAADVGRSSQESGGEARFGPQPSVLPPDPTPTTTEAPPEPSTTTTTVAPEPEPTTTVAPVVVRRTTTTVELPSPQSRTTGRGSEPPANDVWWSLALCEDEGRNRDFGPYSGYFHFLPSTYHAYGGVGQPSANSYEAQRAVAQRLQAVEGWWPWPGCKAKLGL